ncbi:hypothetical protein CAS74_001832 [Pichia kudriavzevii]|uniref:Abhydrolase domain-containing protein IMO32 n=1 Tax=Pichia kudriavzevii TaxID=4909 RepID=A0A099NZI2_PICKU|nr:uncharacterized protein C5L36_0A06290 [Pichia kudriavzevii]AWU74035.1 hypothetical protein C5L36_0A06290 [Pichia kudriavzevii]KGK37266.1 hypothetical protein JL09_g3585 [Pichia kudriavzevii]ONH70942.1 Abhydrolase domain-containing protein IMO32 [Pichia kudriavzevii]OUT23512.1 hypothetical protein CAS74_001832 [Pichia kudriavzevii]
MLQQRSRQLLTSWTRRYTTLGSGTHNCPYDYEATLREALGDVPTVKLAFDKYSNGGNVRRLPPLVLLHGLFGNRGNMRSVAKRLASGQGLISNGFDVYTLDLRNHGGSPHIDRHDYPSMAADVEEFIRNEGIDTPLILGHSMGAKVAMAIALRGKVDICGIIPVENAPIAKGGVGSNGGKFGKYIQVMQEIEERGSEITSLRECHEILGKLETNKTIRDFLLTNMRPIGVKGENGYKCRLNLKVLGEDLDKIAAFPFDPRISRYNGPTFFIRGTQSPFISDEKIEACGLFFPKFELANIDAGHWVISEKPIEFLQIVDEWIDKEFN